MFLAAVPIARVLATCGATYLAAILVLVATRTPLGSRLFFAVTAAMTIAYAVTLVRIWREPHASKRLLWCAFGLALAFRIPPAVAPVGSDSDMVRYIWDGRVQRLGYNPYAVLPSDPALAHTHVDGSAEMPSRNVRTPYPPAAQVFFRMVVTVSESRLAMKLALLLCDLLTIAVLWRWLAIMGRSEWLTLTYAWNPLVVLEVAHSGHVDALGTLWIVASAFWLTRRRTGLATIAFVLAVGTKLMPIVLVPLFLGRIARRDAFFGALFLVLLYLPFSSGGVLPLGAVPNVVEYIRFNSYLFSRLSLLSSPTIAAGITLTIALGAAAWARWRLDVSDPAAWAWPMVCAPVIYPWYILYLTPFLFSVATLPLAAWTISILPVYEVWHISRNGGRWRTPSWVTTVELGTFALTTLATWLWSRRRRVTSPAREPAELR
jgi:alpha-1,6-mannosyltransferase